MASEIVQQVFVNTYEGKHKLNPEYSLKSFLYRSAFNKFIDMYRKKKSMSALHEQYYFLLEQLTSNEIDLSDKLKLMNLKIESLPSRTKEIFCLSKQNGLSNVEISEILNISLKTVEGHITKAFKLLRNELISSKN
jgi:RNA polymerase sigma-70 factor (ECF subfamily)